MTTAVIVFGLAWFCWGFKGVAADQLEGFIQWECRDRHLWILVVSAQAPRLEAVDGSEVHLIDKQLASRCGYTISSLKPEPFYSFRASYYSCFTHNQNDEAFVFKFNVMVSDRSGRWSSRSVSALCPGLVWTHREIICEEDYMEVNVNRQSSCGSQAGEAAQVWQEALFQAQKTASFAWQLMFLQEDGRFPSMSPVEAQRWGYSLTASTHRLVLRAPYKRPHATLTKVDGVPIEVLKVFLFFKQKLLVVMIDMSIACPVNSAMFDGTRLQWDIPQIIPPLVGDGAKFESQNFSLGVEGHLLDKPTAAARGLSLIQQGGLVKLGVPFGAEGGYTKSIVLENLYKEAYMTELLYEHVFLLVFEDGSSFHTKHRMLKVLETPLICRVPFILNKTISEQQMFSIYLGNIPADVFLEEVRINGKQLLVSGEPRPGLGIRPVVHLNGSRGYELQLAFDDPVVRWTNMGGGVVLYTIDANFTLAVMPQRQTYHYNTVITAKVLNAFPPEITAQCLEGGISFSVVRPTISLWEVGIDQEPLTVDLVAQRGYRLLNDTVRTVLEVPIFSVGYTYEEINLSNFYATFKLLLRDSKTLEIQASTSKRCLFKTRDMIVCSPDGTMTVVATPTSTWPSVQPERTSLLDRHCRPKQTDASRALFEFKLDSCGTRAVTGDWYVVYENEILHDRQLIADGPNFISREPQFKVTVRCFYPLSSINRLSVDRFSEAPGIGSIKVFQSHKDPQNKQCPHQPNSPLDQFPPNVAAGENVPQRSLTLQPEKSHSIPELLNSNRLASTNPLKSLETQTQQVPELNRLPDGRTQWVRFKMPNQSPAGPTWEGPNENLSKLFSGISDTLGSGDLTGWGQKTQPLGSPGYDINTEGPIHQPASSHELPHAPDLHPLLPPQYHIGDKLLVPSRDKTQAPISSTYKVTDWSKKVLEPLGTRITTLVSRDAQAPNGGEMENKNVQSIRVKPPSKFKYSSPNLNQKPLVQKVNPQTENLHASSRQMNLWTPQQIFDNRNSNTREDHAFQGSKVSSLQEPTLHGIKPDPLKPGTGPSPKHTTQQKKWVPSLVETGQKKWELSEGGDLQSAGMPHVGYGDTGNVRSVVQNPEMTSRMHLHSSAHQMGFNTKNMNSSVASWSTLENSSEDLDQRRSLSCGGESDLRGTSVHQGLIRRTGKWIS
ncbi:uncharacterized protein LOC112157602 isoform X2 [Oryzias melastigma]|uniref:Uncharacterized LOC112157602 n=1 Tax=Oryzias melastigma TaxID=30732 RepID=A0A3B3DZ68_ORYME|nr:uncharacterized protein LOC112157602 isoform X2 [Oryzias melastigma]